MADVAILRMNRDVAKAEFNTSDKSASKHSWPVSNTEILDTTRASRSSKPEVLYHLSPPQTSQAKSTQSETLEQRIQPATQTTSARQQPSTIKQSPSVSQPPLGRQPSLQPSVSHTPSLLVLPPTDRAVGSLPQNTDNEGPGAQQGANQPPLQSTVRQPPPPPTQPPLIDGAAVPLPDSDDDDVFEDPLLEDDMAEERHVTPPAFSGKPEEDGDAWIRHFLNYCRYREYNDAKSLALIKVLLTGNAAVWLDSLPQDTVANFDRLQQAFNERYKTPEILKYKSAKEIFSRRQQPNESCDEYIAHMRKLARQIEADEKMTRYAILNGLSERTSSFVTQQRPQTIDSLLEAARLAELTNPPKPASETALSEQLAEVQSEVKKLALKWDYMTTAPISDRQEHPTTDGRSPSPRRRVSFNVPRGVSMEGYNAPRTSQTKPTFRPTSAQFAPQRQNYGGNQQRTGGWRGPNPQAMARRPTGELSPCPKCGRRPHSHPNYCPAINKTCNYCLKVGHFSAVCRAAARDRQRQRNTE